MVLLPRMDSHNAEDNGQVIRWDSGLIFDHLDRSH